jgi:hypothetical protein
LVHEHRWHLAGGKDISCGVKHLPKLADACAAAMRKAEELDLI